MDAHTTLSLAVMMLAVGMGVGMGSLWIVVGFLAARVRILQQQLDGLRAVVMGEDD